MVCGSQPSVSTLRSFAASFAVRPSQLALVVSDDVIDMPRVPTLPRPHDDSFFHDSPKVRTPSVIVGAFG